MLIFNKYKIVNEVLKMLVLLITPVCKQIPG